MSFLALTQDLGRQVTAHLGEPARLVPVTGSPVEGAVLLTRPTEARLLGEAGVVAAAPRVEVPVSLLSELRRGDQVETLGRRWKVVSVPRRSADGLFWTADVQDEGALTP